MKCLICNLEKEKMIHAIEGFNTIYFCEDCYDQIMIKETKATGQMQKYWLDTRYA